MGIRTERHRVIAEEHIRAHQAMTEAHIAGRAPVSRRSLIKPGVRVFMPQTGERIVQNSIYGEQDPVDGALKELRMFWARIPDFGIKEFAVFPAESGWVQVLKWSGTGEDGTFWAAQEASAYETDAVFEVTRIEIYSDTAQWMAVAAYASGSDPATFGVEDYFAAVAAA